MASDRTGWLSHSLGCRIWALAGATILWTALGVPFASSARADIVLVEAESGSVPNPGCGDDGPMATEGHSEASGFKVVFHPGSGCTVTFDLPNIVGLGSIRYFTTGYVGTHCGHFVVSGAVSGSSRSVCASNDTWLVMPFDVVSNSGSTYSIAWVTESDTPTWVNSYVDFHQASVSASSQCSDGVDNDGDGRVDYPVDRGCVNGADTSESPDPPECSDGLDNDADGRTDYGSDPDCSSTSDPTENSVPQCSDGRDNDADSRVDYPGDPGCSSGSDTSESPDPPQCSDGRDNDGDGLADASDPGCSGSSDNSEYTPQCSDGTDNDGDGKSDYPGDPGCWTSSDDSESPNPECSDGIDNDMDFLSDSDDPGCSGDTDPTESTPACSNGDDDDMDEQTDYPDDPGCYSRDDTTESPDPLPWPDLSLELCDYLVQEDDASASDLRTQIHFAPSQPCLAKMFG